MQGIDEVSHNLISRVRNRDPRALGDLLRLYGPAMLRIATIITGDEDSADDVVQDVGLRIWSLGESLNITSGVRQYLLAATRNQALSALRHRNSQRRLTDELASEINHAHPATYNYALESLTADDLAKEVYQVLENLPKRCSQIFLLNWRDQLDPEEIADALGVGVRTVQNQIARAVRLLTEHLRPKNM